MPLKDKVFLSPYASERQSVISEQSHKGRRNKTIPESGRWVGQSSQANRGFLHKVFCGNRGELDLSAFKIYTFNYIEIFDCNPYCTCLLYGCLYLYLFHILICLFVFKMFNLSVS